MNIGIIGAGLIGNKRAQAIAKFKHDSVLAVVDVDEERARSLAKSIGCDYFTNPQKIIENHKIDAVIVATVHKYLASISLEALRAGKHVLCEKPLGINSAEIKRCIRLSKKNKLIYKAGYNHRFHPAISKAYKFIKRGRIGKLMFVKASYGHGARPGYHKEWRAQKELSGGGELLDQGSHLIDLILWITGKKVSSVHSILATHFWPMHPLEDNAFVLLELGEISASFHTSWTQWKNEFIFEVYGNKGYIKVNGLGGSYGKETLVVAKGAPGVPPVEKRYEFDGPDDSWALEWKNFREAARDPEKLLTPETESLEVMSIIEKIYKANGV